MHLTIITYIRRLRISTHATLFFYIVILKPKKKSNDIRQINIAQA
jgi:hypothetical protein